MTLRRAFTPARGPEYGAARGARAALLAVGATALLAACGAAPARVAASPTVRTVTLADDESARAPLVTGDVVAVDAPGAPWLTGVYRVGANGTVVLPRVGHVLARGRPLAALVPVFDAFPEVTCVTLAVHSRLGGRIAVGGEVRHPGLLAPRDTVITLGDALAAVGGTTSRADEARIVVERVERDSGRIVRVVMPLAPAGRIFPLAPGDAVVVPTEGHAPEIRAARTVR